jgi:hypothetical protein
MLHPNHHRATTMNVTPKSTGAPNDYLHSERWATSSCRPVAVVARTPAPVGAGRRRDADR